MQKSLLPETPVALYYLSVSFKQAPNQVADLLNTFLKMKKYRLAGSAMEILIDEANGFTKKVIEEFALFYFEFVIEKLAPTQCICYTMEDLQACITETSFN